MTILVDDEYEAANRRAAQFGKQLVLERFVVVYGPDEGARVFNRMIERMSANIRRDGRATAPDVPIRELALAY